MIASQQPGNMNGAVTRVVVSSENQRLPSRPAGFDSSSVDASERMASRLGKTTQHILDDFSLRPVSVAKSRVFFEDSPIETSFFIVCSWLGISIACRSLPDHEHSARASTILSSALTGWVIFIRFDSFSCNTPVSGRTYPAVCA